MCAGMHEYRRTLCKAAWRHIHTKPAARASPLTSINASLILNL